MSVKPYLTSPYLAKAGETSDPTIIFIDKYKEPMTALLLGMKLGYSPPTNKWSRY